MLTGNNTIVKNAQEAKIETEIAEFVEKVKIIVSGAYNEKGNFDGEKLKRDLTSEGIDYTIKDEEIWIEKPYGGYIIISIKTGEIKEDGSTGGNPGGETGKPTVDPTVGQYTIKYNASGGTGTMENQTLKLNESKALLDNQFTREGYIFGGWSKEENGEKLYNGGQVVTNVTTNKDEEVNLYAVWVATTYAVAYELNGGTLEADNPTYTTYDTEIIMDNPTKQGYEFAGWTITGMTPTSHKIGDTITSVETISGIKDTSFKNLRNDVGTVTFTAIWTAKTDTPYTVNHYLMDTTGNYPSQDDPTATQNLVGKSDETLTITNLQQPYTGLQYSYGQVDGNTATTTTILSNGSRVINLYYTRNKPTISFNGNGGTNPSAITDYYEVPITTKPTREGHTFNGWYTSATDGTKVEKIPAENTTLYAHWTVNTYTLTYDGNGGSTPSATTAAYGSKITATSTKTGYTFKGWFTATSGGSPVTTMPLNGGKVYAQWTANTYTLTYDGNGGSTPSATTAAYGSQITATSTRTGYTFKGWFTATSGGTPVTTMPLNGGKVYAQWTVNTYTLTYDGNGGSTPSATTATYGSNITATSTRSGYIFQGWYTATSGGTKVTTMPANGGKVYAQWKSIFETVGAEVTVGGEKFFVIEASPESNTKVKLLAKYCINRTATAQVDDTYHNLNVTFSSKVYWTAAEEDLNKSTAPSGSAYQKAKKYGTKIGGSGTVGRLLTKTEAENLIPIMYDKIVMNGNDWNSDNAPYWLGTSFSAAGENSKVYTIHTGYSTSDPINSQYYDAKQGSSRNYSTLCKTSDRSV